MSREQVNLLFQVIAARYELGALIVTSNLQPAMVASPAMAQRAAPAQNIRHHRVTPYGIAELMHTTPVRKSTATMKCASVEIQHCSAKPCRMERGLSGKVSRSRTIEEQYHGTC